MTKSKFLQENRAENTKSLSKLVTWYVIALWIPLAISAIGGVIGMIYVVNIDLANSAKVGIIIGICIVFVIELVFILAFQSFIRLHTYHLERINYNTELLIEALEKLEIKTNEENKTESNNDVLETEFNNASKNIELMLSLKQINDKQFDLYIKSLEELGTYKNSNILVPIYKQKYEELKKANDPQTKDYEKEIYNKLVNLLDEGKISNAKYKEYYDLVNTISKNKSINDRIAQYKKLLSLLSTY